MKSVTGIIFLASAISVSAACANSAKTASAKSTVTTSATGDTTSTTVTSAATTPAGTTIGGFVEDKYTLKVTGMTCGACSSKIETALKSVPGVGQAAANSKTGEVRVVSSGPSKLDRKLVIKAIEDQGFKVQQ